MPSQLTYLKINEFRHVKPGSVIEFGPQFNVVVGRNGAGKTTLLNLVSAFIRNNFHQFKEEHFSLSFRLVDQDASLEGTLTNTVDNRRSSLELSGIYTHGNSEVHITSDADGSSLRHDGHKLRGPAILPTKEPQGVAFDLIHLAKGALLSLGNQLDQQMIRHLAITSKVFRYDRRACTRVTEGAETFTELFSRQSEHSERGGNLGFTVIEFSGDRTEVLHNLASQDDLIPRNQAGLPDSVTLGNSLDPLAQFIRLSQYRDARIILIKTAFQTRDGKSQWFFGDPLARFTSPNGNEIPHPQLSFGEKRLLAFLIKLYAYPSTIIVDELANGMHHSWLEQCIELLDDLGTQAFLSSQNPLLLDYLPLSRETYGSQHTLVVCELDESGEMIWRNLSAAETKDFFRSLEVGLQHISEIMRSKGLW